MTTFVYKARDPNGVARAGTVDASSKKAAAVELRTRGLIVVGIDADHNKKSGVGLTGFRWTPIRSVHVETSLQQLALMLRSGMTLLASIQSLVKQSPSPSMQRVWERVIGQVQRGSSFSDALQQHRCFPVFAVRLVKVGEQTGNIHLVLQRASTTMRTRRAAREEFWSATIYPVLIILLSLFVTAYMVVFLIPRLEIYLQSLGKEMPAMTQNLMDGSFWLRQNIIYVCEILAVAAVTLIAIYRTNKGRFEIDRWALRIPLFGKLLRLRENISFARSVSMMLKSGITLTEALGTVVQMTDNHYMNRTINLARTKIVQGSNLTDALNDRFAFTPMLQQMVAVGQQSGELETVLAEVAELHESQFKTTVKRLNSILAPLMTFFIGGIVGYVYIAFFVALFSAGT